MSLAESATSGAAWSVIAAVGRRFVTIVTTVILARLLSPADFGLVALAAMFVGFVELIRDVGTGAGIIQTETLGDELLSSIFWLNVGFGVVATAALIAVAPLAAAFLREPRLSAVLMTLSISVLFAALSVVHAHLLTREMRFRQLAAVELAGSVAGGALGIALALNDYGVWSLIWQSVGTVLSISFGMTVVSGWRPRRVFTRSSLTPILGFSANLTGFNVVNYVIRNADNFLIGRHLGAPNLGLYDLAYRTLLFPLQLVSWAIGRALFPLYARMQDDRARLGAAYLRVVRAIALVTFPLTIGVAAVAEPFVETIFGPAWMPAAPVVMILGPVAALQAVGTTVGHIYQAVGRTDLMLRWAAGAGVLLVGAFIVGLQWGIVGVAACYAVVSYALAYHLFRIPLKLIGLPVRAVALAVRRPLVCTAVMLLAILIVDGSLADAFSAASRLGVLIPVAAAVYACSTWMYNRENALEVARLVGTMARP